MKRFYCLIYPLFAALMILAAPNALAATPSAYPKWISVIDAGSSGTRLYFYKVSENGLVEMLTSNFEYKEEDGIDNFVCDLNHPQSDVMKIVITPLLTKLKEQGKSLSPAITPGNIEVNLLATAGMRSRQATCEKLYPGEGAKKTASLYKLIKNGIKSQGFKAGEVRTSDGNKEEGPWTWLNLNYILGTLDTSPYGDLEVGGSSAQIVFPVDPNKNPANDAQNIYTVLYKGKSYTVFAKSYLGFGQDDARKWVRNSTASPEKCWAKGFSYLSDKGEKEASFKKLERNGDFDYGVCSGYYKQYIQTKMDEQGGGPLAGRSLGDFVGLDGAWYAYEYFLTPLKDAPSQLTTAIPALCADAAKFESITTNGQVQNQCPSGTFVTTLMFDPAGFFKDSARKVTIARSNDRIITVGGMNVNEREITWTRGYLLQRYFAN